MKVADVIREADSDCVIYFLLNSYIGTVRDCDKLRSMPDKVAVLPLADKDDVRIRFEILMFELDAASKRLDDKKCADIREALAVFGTALYRLHSIACKRPPRMELKEMRTYN